MEDMELAMVKTTNTVTAKTKRLNLKGSEVVGDVNGVSHDGCLHCRLHTSIGAS